MKNNIWILVFSIILFSCSKKNNDNFIVKGKIIGLKKGTIYLEKIENQKLIAIDSIFINDGTEEITFSNSIKESEIYILSLDKSNAKQVSFFGEPGTINITTNLQKFYFKAQISGSKQQDLLEKHDGYIKKISDKNLDLIKEKFEAQKKNDLQKAAKIQLQYNQNLKRQYLFSANYAITHKDKAIAPFIAYSRMQKATTSLKQKIYDALTPEIKNSKYGLLLKESLN